jgi:hypothetical protein
LQERGADGESTISPPCFCGECQKAGGGDSMILVARAAADPDASDDFAVTLEWDSAGEDHYSAMIRPVIAEELAATAEKDS